MGSGYCKGHGKRKAERYERHRGTSTHRGYNANWRRYRLAYLGSYPWCVECDKLANVVDHIVPHRGSYALFWDPGNHQAMCDRCHSSKTAREDGGFGNATRGGGVSRAATTRQPKPGGSEIFTGTLPESGVL